MNIYILKHSQRKQQGAATLFISVMLLVAITLVALSSGKTVINETKIAANQYRTAQAVAAANYAMDLGVNYFDTGGFDRFNNADGSVGEDGCADSIIDIDNDGDSDGNMNELSLTSTDGSQTLLAELSFDNNEPFCRADDCDTAQCPLSSDQKAGQITAIGYSDDGLAMRRITQWVGPLAALNNDGPEQPLVAQGQVALSGHARIINRFTSTTIWSGDKVTIGSSAAMETFIRSTTLDSVSSSGDDVLDPNDPDDRARLLSTDDSKDAQLVSNRNLGNGLDIIDDDSSLNTLIGIDFFTNFFRADSRVELKLQAGSQVYNDIDLAKNDTSTTPDTITTGLVWVEGDQDMTGGTIGDIDNPAIVYIHGDFRLNGGTIYGVLYVAGVYTVAGNPTVIGANIVEGTDFSGSSEVLASPPIVKGNGTLSLIYWRGIGSGGNNNMPGESAVISGSWRDW